MDNEVKTSEKSDLEQAAITVLEAENAALKEELAEAQKLLNWYIEQFKLAQQRQYGRKSESFGESYEQMAMLDTDVFNEAEATADANAEEPGIEEVKTYRRKKRKHVEGLPEELPVLEEIKVELTDEEKKCPVCGGTMHICGHEALDEIVVIPAQVGIRRYTTETASCRLCEQGATGEGAGATPMVKSKLPSFPIAGSWASAELISHTMCQKYVMGAPLYRQEKDWERQGVLLSRQTMSNWFMNVEKRLMRPVYERMWEELLGQEILHSDETTLNVLRDPKKTTQGKSYMWFYGSGKYEKRQIMMYEWCRNRRQENPQQKLRDYRGYIHVDGYQGYHNLNGGITVVGCAAHARRKFADIIKAMPGETQKGTAALGAVKYWDRLFELERRWDKENIQPEERKGLRAKYSKPLLEEYYKYLGGVNALPKSALGTAIAYSINQREYLENYLKDGRLELSNNRAERSIKLFVIDRNYALTKIMSCRRQNVVPRHSFPARASA
jgi:transposase